MPLPLLPTGAAYLKLYSSTPRNNLTLQALKDLKSQLVRYNTDVNGELHLLRNRDEHLRSTIPRWLRFPDVWEKQRGHLPKVLVLRSEGPVFSNGHDNRELHAVGHSRAQETFDLCAEVMGMIKGCPVPVVCAIQGYASGAGFQLAMCTDYPIALADTMFRLPGMQRGFPDTSSATSVSRRVPPALAYRMFMTGEDMRADQLHGAVDVVPMPAYNSKGFDATSAAFESRIDEVVRRLLQRPAQPQAFGKWAFWTQLNVQPGLELEWAAKVMAQHSAGANAREGIDAFVNKRKPDWLT